MPATESIKQINRSGDLEIFSLDERSFVTNAVGEIDPKFSPFFIHDVSTSVIYTVREALPRIVKYSTKEQRFHRI
jgi:hypothetical protein